MKSCNKCINQDSCIYYEQIEPESCERFMSYTDKRISVVQEEAKEYLQKEVPNYTDINNLIKYLKDKSVISANGRMNITVPVNKEALRLAAVYLEDYLYTMEGLYEDSSIK